MTGLSTQHLSSQGAAWTPRLFFAQLLEEKDSAESSSLAEECFFFTLVLSHQQ